jgi:hypothetical protein
VPRFLFRAFTLCSGGGSSHAINTPDAIVPHTYMDAGLVPSFYSVPEKRLWNLANKHFRNEPSGDSPCSSWTASLHLVLCYAHCLQVEARDNGGAYVAVVDTDKFRDELQVWHAPHLINVNNHEFLAHGRVQYGDGDGYVAVSFLDLIQRGLHQVFPELVEHTTTGSYPERFGHALRSSVFNMVSPNRSTYLQAI